MNDTSTPRTGELYDNHMHTMLCNHAKGEPEEYAEIAFARGLAGITFTCHNPLPGQLGLPWRMEMSQLDEYQKLIARAADAYKDRVSVRLGLECDYWPGLEPFLEHQLQSAPFSHVLGSVHSHMGYYKEAYPARTMFDFQKTYFTHLAQAAESGLFDTISHPDLVKNDNPDAWNLPALFDHVCDCLDRIAKSGTAMELNTSGLNKKIPEFNPGPEILAQMAKRKIPVVIGSDSHEPQRVGADFESALGVIQKAGYEDVSYFINRKRVIISIDDALSVLRPLDQTSL